MIAAAAAALVGIATAANCNEGCDCPVNCTFGYRLKVMVRTTGSCSVTKQDACNECSTATYRGPVIRRFMGLVYGVDPTGTGKCGETACGCNEWDDAWVAIYDYDNSTPMYLDADTTELLQLNRIGCFAADRQKAEMAFTLGFTCTDSASKATNVSQMTFVGFGLCGNHNGQITIGAISGYCAGLLPAGGSYTTGPCQDPTQVCYTMAWKLCCNQAFKCAYTAAYGKWTLIWDSSIAAKVGSNLLTGSQAAAKNTTASATTGWGVAPAVQLAKWEKMCAEACTACVETCQE